MATKFEIKKLAEEFGCTTHYSGKDRVMYIDGEQKKAAVQVIRDKLKPAHIMVLEHRETTTPKII